MSLNALNTATAGLKTTQAAIAVVSQNIANVGTAGYTKRGLSTVSSGVGNSGVATSTLTRALDTASQNQLRLETSGSSYTSTVSNIRTQLDKLYGTPGSSTALDGVFNSFTLSLQTLATDATSVAARAGVVSAASTLATKIKEISLGVQSLRTATESQLGSDTTSASELLSSIATLNTKIAASIDESGKADLLDQRDQKVTDLSKYMDLQTVAQRDGTVTVMTKSGVTLVDRNNAATLSFDGRGTLSPDASYSLDDTKRGVGTILATMPGGSRIDLVATGAIRSGSLAAGIELRDTDLPQAQRQLDDLAAGLSRSLSDRSATGSAVKDGAASGFDIDLTGLSAGNAVTLNLKDASGVQRTLVLMPYASTSEPTIGAADTNDPTATVVPIKLDGTPTGLRDAIQSALGSTFTVSNQTGGGTGGLRIVTNGTPTILGVNASVTQSTSTTDLQNGRSQLPLFVDGTGGGTLYTGSFDSGSQLTGFAQRITVNPSVQANTASLVTYGSATTSADTTRPQYLHDALTTATRTFSASSGIGGVQAPYTASVQGFAQSIISAQGAAAQTAQTLDQSQSVALATAQSRVSSVSGVSIDEEMSKLVQLQTAYSANARVLTAARDLLDTLLRI